MLKNYRFFSFFSQRELVVYVYITGCAKTMYKISAFCRRRSDSNTESYFPFLPLEYQISNLKGELDGLVGKLYSSRFCSLSNLVLVIWQGGLLVLISTYRVLIWKVSLLVLWQVGLFVPIFADRVPDLEGELSGPVESWTVSSQFCH